MRYVRTITKAYYDFGESNYIPSGKVVEVLDTFYDTKLIVLDNGFKRVIKKEDVEDVYVLLVFKLHQKIKKFYINTYNITKLDYYLNPKVYIDFDEGCLKEYRESCLKIVRDDLKRAYRSALILKNTIHNVIPREP